jgi:CubicO group peptidase (beta-lactamase class C family)
MNPRKISLIIWALTIGFTACFAQEQNRITRKADSLFSQFNSSPGPGLALVVVKDGKVVLEKGYGLANMEYIVPIAPATVFDLASLSKQFTGFAISMLIEQGKIRPEEDIRKYIPELPDFGKVITIENLLRHTSGIRDWCGSLALAGWNMEDVITFEQILNMSFHQKELNFEPGSAHLYSNTGYNLLAELVHRVTGQTLRQWTDANLFGPLGMNKTHFRDDYSEIFTNRAYGYYQQENAWHVAQDNLTAVGSSSLFSTVDDLSKWMMNLDDPKVGTRSMIDRMVQPGKLNDGSPVTYAYGLISTKYRGMTEIFHDGSWAAFTTFLAYYPEQHLSVAVLSNGSARVKKATHDLVDLFLEKPAEPAKAVTSGTAAKSDGETIKKPELSPVHPADYTGVYFSEELQTRYEISVEKGVLKAVHFKNGAIPLTPSGTDQFSGSEWYMETVKFYRDDKGNVKGFLVTIDRCRNQRFIKI